MLNERSRPVAFALCALIGTIAPTAAQKITTEDVMKPYDAKTRPDYGPPASSPPARSWRLPGFSRSECRCIGCGCNGGSGWRTRGGSCVSHANLTRDCGSPPSLRCTHEGAQQVCPSGR